jgi:hypothetical protein
MDKLTPAEAVKACRDMAYTLRTNETVQMPSPEEWDGYASLIEQQEADGAAMREALEEIRIIADKSMIADPILSEIYAIADDATNKQTCDNCGQPWKMCNGVKVGCVCKNWKERTEPDVENCENCAHEKSKKWCWSCGFKDGKPYSNWQAIDAALSTPPAPSAPQPKVRCGTCGELFNSVGRDIDGCEHSWESCAALTRKEANNG